MTVRHERLVLLGVLALLLLLSLLGLYTAHFPVPATADKTVLSLYEVAYETAGGLSGSLELPARLGGLAPGEAVTLTAQVPRPPGSALLVGTVSAPMEVFLNGEPALSYGQKGSYPAFFQDPPIALILLPLPTGSRELTITVQYLAPSQRSALEIPVMRLGSERALYARQFYQDGFFFVFSLLLIFSGLVVMALALLLFWKIHPNLSFFWLGLFALLAGYWGLGECDLTLLFFPYPSGLHVMVFLSIFLIPIPFLHFGLLVLNPRQRWPMQLVLGLDYLSLAAALVLQLTGQVDFIRSLEFYQGVLVLNVAVFLFSLAREWLGSRNPAAGRFGPGILILSVFTMLEMLNFWFHWTGAFTFFFQLGVLGFVLSLGIVGVYFVRDSLRTTQEKERLEYQMKSLNLQLALQRLQVQKITENEARVEAQRHDLRHHLTVLWELYEQDDREKLRAYLEALRHRQPAGAEPRLCENFAVNAVASHYATLARQTGADVSIALSIPEPLSPEFECDLCILLGNLMENAAEACGRMTGAERFIRVQSELRYGVLTVAVDNSFEGELCERAGLFLSSKREGEGIGLTSVTAVAQKHGGNAQFEAKDGVFRASAYVRLEQNNDLSAIS